MLRLLEALLQTLPHLLLQTYVVVAVDPAGFIPGEFPGGCVWVRDMMPSLEGCAAEGLGSLDEKQQGKAWLKDLLWLNAKVAALPQR